MKTSDAIIEDILAARWKLGRTADLEAAMRVANHNAKEGRANTIIFQDGRGYGVLFHHEFYALPENERGRFVAEKGM